MCPLLYTNTKYVNANLKDYDKDIQDNVKELLQDLLEVVKKEDFVSCRKLEHEILKTMNLE